MGDLALKRIFLFACLLLSACASVEAAREHAAEVAGGGLLVPRRVAAGRFQLSTWQKLLDPGKPLHVFIEGDGLSWVSRDQPAMDPTPRNPVGLELAASDRWPNVFCLARPCQFTPHEKDPSCEDKWWTSHRSAPEVIDAMDAAISKVVQPGQKLRLIGYSGGGGVAALVAARRNDVESLITVAGNLDHVRLNAWHHVAQTPQSLNPIDVAGKLARVPQIHFVGERDVIVPAEIARAWQKASNSSCVQIVETPGATHGGGWKESWGWMQKMIPSCAR